MKVLIDCRAMETMCRKRALADEPNEWEAHADRWHDVGYQEVAHRFQDNNAANTTATSRNDRMIVPARNAIEVFKPVAVPSAAAERVR